MPDVLISKCVFVVQMTCGDIFTPVFAWYIVKIAAKMLLKRIEYCVCDIGYAILFCSNLGV